MKQKFVYAQPKARIAGLRLEKTFCESTQLGNTVGIADMTSSENDFSGYWED